MMNRYEPSYGRSDYGGGDFGLFGGYPTSAMAPPPTAVPAPYSAGPPPPPSLMSLTAVPPLMPPPPSAPVPFPQASLPPPSVLPPPSHLHAPAPSMDGPGVAAGSAGMSTTGVNTNSRHPLAVKARVFVGNLNTNAVSREEFEQMFRRFGDVLAVSMHRGYGFIQYAHEYEARNAISFTDGMILGGQRLDVNLASEPKSGRESKATKRQAESNSSDGNAKRARGSSEGKSQSASTTAPKPLFPSTKSSGSTNVEVNTSTSNATAKTTTPTKSATIITTKPASANIAVVTKKTEPATKAPTSSAPATTASRPVPAATVVKTEVNGTVSGSVPCVQAPGATESSPDILICGQCRSLFNNITAFTAHRKENGLKCVVPTGDGKSVADKNAAAAPKAAETKLAKVDGEPEALLCFLCEKSFDHSWRLVDHISKGHGISVYHTSKAAAEGAEKGQATKEKILAGAAAIAEATKGVAKTDNEEPSKTT